MSRAGFWLRWSWRDLRARWPLVIAIGLLLAGGIGLAAGLASMRDWRIASNDASFASLRVHDLRVAAEPAPTRRPARSPGPHGGSPAPATSPRRASG